MFLIALVFSQIAAANPACPEVFPSPYVTLMSEGLEVRTYRHELAPNMELIRNPNVIFSAPSAAPELGLDALVIRSNQRPDENGAILNAPVGYYWQLRAHDIQKRYWHYKLQPLHSSPRGKPARILPFDIRTAHDKDFFQGDKPYHDPRVYRQLGVTNVKGDLLFQLSLDRTAGGPISGGSVSDLLRRSLAVRNQRSQYLVVFREGDHYVVGIGRRARNMDENREVVSLSYGENRGGDELKSRVAKEAREYFRELGLSEDQLWDLGTRRADYFPVALSSQLGILYVMINVSAIDGPTVRSMFETLVRPNQ